MLTEPQLEIMRKTYKNFAEYEQAILKAAADERDRRQKLGYQAKSPSAAESAL